MTVVTVACCLWDANQYSQPFSREYSEDWVERLYRGFARNLTRQFEFVVFTEKSRTFNGYAIRQERLAAPKPNYSCLIEPFRLNKPMIMCGLDMVILKNIDHYADYCLNESVMALPRDPYKPEQLINPIALVPAGHKFVYDAWRGENDMQWLRTFPWVPMDDLWPGEVRSLKAHKVRDYGPGDARIVYMHGNPKPPALTHLPWVKEHWR